MNVLDNETVKSILSRRSVRSYTEKELSRDIIEKLLLCAMWAPSARNIQPCHVRALTDKSALESMNTDYKNKIGWDVPAYSRWDENAFYQGAPAVFFIFAETKSFIDAGIMVENIALAAESMNLGSCIIGCIRDLFDAPEGEKWKKLLNIPEDWHFLISIAVGEKAECPRPKERKPENFKIIDKI